MKETPSQSEFRARPHAGYIARRLNFGPPERIVAHYGELNLTCGPIPGWKREDDLAGIAKAGFRFRSLRAKAATDKAEHSGDIRQAQSSSTTRRSP